MDDFEVGMDELEQAARRVAAAHQAYANAMRMTQEAKQAARDAETMERRLLEEVRDVELALSKWAVALFS